MKPVKPTVTVHNAIPKFWAYLATRRLIVFVVITGIVVTGLFAVTPSTAQTATGSGSVGTSGLPLPRFVSLKSNRVNVRGGPSQDHAISWVFLQQGLPVEIIAEFENWRQIRDSDGEEGWVFHSLLSARRTALVAPWSDEEFLTLRLNLGDDSELVAKLEPGILSDLDRCSDGWCQISVQQIEGWIAQDLLFGTYPDEVIN